MKFFNTDIMPGREKVRRASQAGSMDKDELSNSPKRNLEASFKILNSTATTELEKDQELDHRKILKDTESIPAAEMAKPHRRPEMRWAGSGPLLGRLGHLAEFTYQLAKKVEKFCFLVSTEYWLGRFEYKKRNPHLYIWSYIIVAELLMFSMFSLFLNSFFSTAHLLRKHTGFFDAWRPYGSVDGRLSLTQLPSAMSGGSFCVTLRPSLPIGFDLQSFPGFQGVCREEGTIDETQQMTKGCTMEIYTSLRRSFSLRHLQSSGTRHS